MERIEPDGNSPLRERTSAAVAGLVRRLFESDSTLKGRGLRPDRCDGCSRYGRQVRAAEHIGPIEARIVFGVPSC
jgi:hypothetical protein